MSSGQTWPVSCRCDSTAQCIIWTFERRADCVADRFENDAVISRNGLAKDRVVGCQRIAHRVGVRFPQPRATLDVREQKGNRPGR